MPGTPAPTTKSPKPAFEVEERQAELLLLNAFNDMDIDGDGIVTKDEFRHYITQHPHGWPLADLLDGQPKEVKEQMITFWFRKLDVNSEGSFDQNELIAFFRAMKSMKYKEALYADFLLNLFDKNFDGNLSQQEFDDMMHVMLGPKAKGLRIEAKAGMSRDELVKLLHRIQCDFNNLGVDAAGNGRGLSFGDFVAVSVVLGAAAAVGLYFWNKLKGKQ